ncbi:MAG: recombination protein O N-terminal domain-containing protein, partial [Bacteroidaceae bacterium]|nr:recombination protein O N-terminal domain-containing protein [Bacteroidaceae bacterium]
MLQKTKGIVLHVLKYADASLIVDVYTERFGRLAFSVRMSKSKRSQVRTSLFQPLALLDMEIDYRPNRQLQRVQSMASEYPYS